MLLAIDVGNTRIKAGLWNGEDWEAQESAPSSAEGLRSLAASGIAGRAQEGICASVVPALGTALEECLDQVRFSFLSAENPLLRPFVDYQSSATLGADRLANGLAMLHRLNNRAAGVAVDLGTATKFDVVTFEDGDGAFRGGAIMPGLAMGAESLTRGTAQLPQIDLEAPEKVVGKTTASCLQSGVLYGHAAAIDGMIERICAELRQEVTVFATGGFADLVLPLCRIEAISAPHLTLEGLVAAHRVLTA